MQNNLNNTFTVKFNNGFWKVFNTVTYTDVRLCYTKKEAQEVALELNIG